MIKARGVTSKGQDVVLIGLSGENITRMMGDEPLRFNLSELGLPSIYVVIVSRTREEDIVKYLNDNGLKLLEE